MATRSPTSAASFELMAKSCAATATKAKPAATWRSAARSFCCVASTCNCSLACGRGHRKTSPRGVDADRAQSDLRRVEGWRLEVTRSPAQASAEKAGHSLAIAYWDQHSGFTHLILHLQALSSPTKGQDTSFSKDHQHSAWEAVLPNTFRIPSKLHLSQVVAKVQNRWSKAMTVQSLEAAIHSASRGTWQAKTGLEMPECSAFMSLGTYRLGMAGHHSLAQWAYSRRWTCLRTATG